MNQTNSLPEIIENLARNEGYIARLYEQYAVHFPDMNEFWSSLAVEEIKHAAWIRKLGKMNLLPSVFINETRFNVTAVQSYTNYLERELARMKTETVPALEALATTFYIEDSLIESRFFEIFETDSAELKNILAGLRTDTEAHRKKAKEELERYKKQAQ